jgi:hypothetical protein
MNNSPYGKEFHCIDCMFDPPNCSLCGRQSIPMALPVVEETDVDEEKQEQ